MTARADRAAGNAERQTGNAFVFAPAREAGNGHVLPISSDLTCCPTCQQWFYRVQSSQRYCCPQHRVTGSKRRRKRLIEAFVIIATTMSDGRISAVRAAEFMDWNAKRVEDVVRAWGYEFNERDELVRRTS